MKGFHWRKDDRPHYRLQIPSWLWGSCGVGATLGFLGAGALECLGIVLPNTAEILLALGIAVCWIIAMFTEPYMEEDQS